MENNYRFLHQASKTAPTHLNFLCDLPLSHPAVLTRLFPQVFPDIFPSSVVKNGLFSVLPTVVLLFYLPVFPENITPANVYLLSLDTKCRILGIFEVGHGTVNACLLHTRKIMIRNLLCGAGTFIVVHNHPSGEVSVSKEDISTTKRLFEAGRLIGIELLDHIIIGRKENGDSYGYAYYSMKEQGLLTTV